MRNKLFFLCGMFAPVVYVGAVIVGGVKRPGYSHISHFVSELIEAGAPNKTLLNPLFALYNLLTMALPPSRSATSKKGMGAWKSANT